MRARSVKQHRGKVFSGAKFVQGLLHSKADRWAESLLLLPFPTVPLDMQDCRIIVGEGAPRDVEERGMKSYTDIL